MRKSRFALLGAVGIALIPATSHAFPFVVAATSITLLPLVLAAVISFFCSRRLMAIGLAATALFLLFLQTQPQVYFDYQSDNETRHAYMMGESKYFTQAIMARNGHDMTKAVSFEEALRDSSARLIFVNPGTLRGQNGFDPYFLLANRSLLKETDVLVSFDSQLARNLASATGLRWVEGGLYGYLERIGQAYAEQTDVMGLPSCQDAESCVHIGLFDASFNGLFAGFPYRHLTYATLVENLILPDKKDLAEIRRLAEGRRLVVELFGDVNSRISQGIYALLRDQGMVDVSVIHHSYDMFANQEANRISAYRTSLPIIEGQDLNFLCANGTQLLVVTDLYNKTDTRVILPNIYRENCRIHLLGIEGLMPHQVRHVLKTQQLDPNARYVGVYSDKLSSFYVLMAGDFLKEQGINVIGLSPVMPNLDEAAMPIRGLVDGHYHIVYGWLQASLGNKAGLAALSIYALALILLSIGLRTSKSRLVAAGFCIMQYLLLALALFACTYHHQSQAAGVLTVTLIVALIQALVPARRLHSKLDGLHALAGMGLKIPRSKGLSWISIRRLRRMLRKGATPLIFRSNERSENRGENSGRYTSVVARSPSDIPDIMRAWNQMKAEGNPGFVVQPHMHFDTTGVVSSATTPEGISMLVFEQSGTPEGITASLDRSPNARAIPAEKALLEDDLLIQQAGHIWTTYGQHFVAEFGICGTTPYWLQLMPSADSKVALRSPVQHGYVYSGLNEEMKQLDPWLLRQIERFVPGLTYRVFAGKLYERPTPSAPFWKGLSSLMPWRCLEALSGWMLGKALRADRLRALPLWLHLAFVLSVLGVYKSSASRVTRGAMPDEATPSLANLPSPFSSRKELKEASGLFVIKTPELISKRILSDVLVRERLRIAITLLLARKSHEADEPLLVEPLLPLGGCTLIAGVRPLNGRVLHADELEALAAAGAIPEGYSTLLLEKPDLGIFAYQAYIGACDVKMAVAFNSHFSQRCRSLGIKLTINKPEKSQD